MVDPDYPTPSGPCSVSSPARTLRIRATRPSTESSARRSNYRLASPRQANEAWARLERELIDQAIIVPVITPKATDFVSKRVGNYQRHPVFGMLISQVWVR